MFRIGFQLLCSGLLFFSARADLITDWNAEALNAIRNESTSPPLAARNLAMLHAAIYDAVNSVTHTHRHYFTNFQALPETSAEAAVVGAAYQTLINLFPSQMAEFDFARTRSLVSITNNAARENGYQLGTFIADLVLDWRSADGASTTVPYIPSTDPGAWRRTPPFFRPPELPQWPYVTCFALTNGSQFRPTGPPSLSSTHYAADFNQVKSLGAINSTNRTAEQTLIARFWSDFSYTVTPPGHWNQIAQNAATNNGLSLDQAAQLFGLLNLSMADAAISVWDAKYTYNFWRPVTAIQNADIDGNAATVADPSWLPLLNTPAFPEYVSGHSAFSGAASTVLARFFGTDEVSFSVSSDALPEIVRSYASFAAAAEEIGMSRIYGGIHFLSADLDGLSTGRSIGAYVERNFLLPLATPATLEIPEQLPQNFRIRVSGTIGVAYVLEASTNLVEWSAVFTNAAPFVFEEEIVNSPRIRFYRAKSSR